MMGTVTGWHTYSDVDVTLNGFVARIDDSAAKPGILLVHGGGGLDSHAKAQAVRYAGLGYVVLACDMFGPGIGGDRDRVVQTLLSLRDDPSALGRRGLAGLEALRSLPNVDGRCAAVGFCFGGMAVLTLARQGADLAGVVSMHGSLGTARSAAPGAITARILACHGASDPHVPLADVTAFIEEMTNAQADWQLLVFGKAVHGFTHADALPVDNPCVAYDALADRRSFDAARRFFEELFVPADSGGG
jgi:dienelactone hydrolase